MFILNTFTQLHNSGFNSGSPSGGLLPQFPLPAPLPSYSPGAQRQGQPGQNPGSRQNNRRPGYEAGNQIVDNYLPIGTAIAGSSALYMAGSNTYSIWTYSGNFGRHFESVTSFNAFNTSLTPADSTNLKSLLASTTGSTEQRIKQCEALARKSKLYNNPKISLGKFGKGILGIGFVLTAISLVSDLTSIGRVDKEVEKEILSKIDKMSYLTSAQRAELKMDAKEGRDAALKAKMMSKEFSCNDQDANEFSELSKLLKEIYWEQF